MKGITPVIAIILLLLMAVAAAGGFYFVYQNFSETGQESGSSQIEGLGQSTLSQIQIESAAGGRIYVKNTGATEIDATALSVYVEGVPVSVNKSTDSISERSRATLKLTELPSCTTEKCEVKISGPASTSQSIDLAKLMCASNSECRLGESCTNGLCSDSVCGDDLCAYPDETGLNCFEDCHPERYTTFYPDPVDLNFDIYDCVWNGSTFVMGENITNNTLFNVLYKSVTDSNGNFITVGTTGAATNDFDDIAWLKHDGSDWSDLRTVSAETWSEGDFLTDLDIDSNDNVIAVWEAGKVGSEMINVAWSLYDGSSWSGAENLTTNTDGNMHIYSPQFSFAADDTGMAVWGATVDGGNGWLNYSIWDGSSWSAVANLDEVFFGGSENVDMKGAEVESNSTHTMVVWTSKNETYDPSEILRWATYDGSSWDGPHNVTGVRSEFGEQVGLEYTDETGWILVVNKATSDPTWLEWFSWDDATGWTSEGNITSENLPGKGLLTEDRYDEVMLVNFGTNLGAPEYKYSYFDGTSWSEYVDFGSVWE